MSTRVFISSIVIALGLVVYFYFENEQPEEVEQESTQAEQLLGKSPSQLKAIEEEMIITESMTIASISKDVQVPEKTEAPYIDRFHCASSLQPDLSEQKVEELVDYLRSDLPDKGMEEELSVRNEVLQSLLRQFEVPEQYLKTLSQIYGNESHANLWRDYALQHFAQYAERKFLDQTLAQDELGVISTVLEHALEEAGSHFPGTALIGMLNLHELDQDFFTKEEVVGSALKIKDDTRYSKSSQLTAWQVLNTLKPEESVSQLDKLSAIINDDPSLGKVISRGIVETGDQGHLIKLMKAYHKIEHEEDRRALREKISYLQGVK